MNLVMSMVRARILAAEEKALALVNDERKRLRDARLAQAKLSPKPRGGFLWSRWTQRIREIQVGK
jgi:hypothetical protein